MAIDEMFVRGDAVGVALWTGGIHVAGFGRCTEGKAALLDVRGEFDDVYRIVAGRNGSHLAGGFVATYVRQGFIMVSVAPSSDGIPPSSLDVLIQAAGRPSGSPDLLPWRSLLLEARQVAVAAPKLTVILCISALDLFFEELSGGSVRSNRPAVWDHLLAEVAEVSLRELLGDDYSNLHRLLGLRNALAHGRDHLPALPEAIREAEDRWLEVGRNYEDFVAPSAQFALRTTLAVTRSVQERLAIGQP